MRKISIMCYVFKNQITSNLEILHKYCVQTSNSNIYQKCITGKELKLWLWNYYYPDIMFGCWNFLKEGMKVMFGRKIKKIMCILL